MLLVLLFNLEDQRTVLGEQDRIFVIETGLQVVSMQDAAELSE